MNKLLVALLVGVVGVAIFVTSNSIYQKQKKTIAFSKNVSTTLETETTPKVLNSKTVMVSNREKSSGGSGFIYRSSDSGSYILTNAHVCSVLETNGGLISTSKGDYSAERYAKSEIHDICAVYVVENLKVNTNIAKTSTYGDKVSVSGHPFLLPNTITDGYLSNNLEITLLIDIKECTEEELQQNPWMCFGFGGMPIIKNFTAQTTSAMIAPGNSGSGIFNSKGEVVGLAFAGIGRGISHGLIVPLQYVQQFVNKEIYQLKWINANSSKRISEFMNSKKRKSTQSVTTKELKNLIFPSIQSEKLENVFTEFQTWKKSQNANP